MIRDGVWHPRAERRKENPQGETPQPLGVTGEEPRGARLGTHVGADLGHSGAQVEHRGDGSDGKSNDLSPGERLQGRGGDTDRDTGTAPVLRAPARPHPAPRVPAPLLCQPAGNYN